MNLAPRLQGYKVEYLGIKAVFGTFYGGVTQAVPAFIMIVGCLNRFPTGRPYSTPVVDVIIASAIVHRNIVVAVTLQATILCILIKSIASCSVRNQRKEILTAQIVDPGPGGFGLFNHILPSFVVKMSKFHLCGYYLVLFYFC